MGSQKKTIEKLDADKINVILIEMSIGLLEVLLHTLEISFNSLVGFVLLPIARNNLTSLVTILKGLDQTSALINGTAHGQIVDLNRTYYAFPIDDEEPTQSNSRIGQQNTKVFGHFAGLVGKQIYITDSNTAFLAILQTPSIVREL